MQPGLTMVGEFQVCYIPMPLSVNYIFTHSPTVNRLKQVALYFATWPVGY